MITDWAESVAGVVSVAMESSTADTVNVPKEDTETRISLVAAAAMVAASRVVEPTATLISTTLEVTVASGARGRWMAAFRRTSCGLRRGTSRYFPRCISDKERVRVGAWICNPSASSLRVPSSEVNNPSFILEPASRGDLESGLDIFSLLAGRSMVDGVQSMRRSIDGGK